MSHANNARIVTALAIVLCVTAVLRGRAATTTAATPTRVTADCCASGDQNAPAEHTMMHAPAADQPAADSTAGTEPVSISGSVSIAKRLDLQAPDLSRVVVYIA